MASFGIYYLSLSLNAKTKKRVCEFKDVVNMVYGFAFIIPAIYISLCMKTVKDI